MMLLNCIYKLLTLNKLRSNKYIFANNTSKFFEKISKTNFIVIKFVFILQYIVIEYAKIRIYQQKKENIFHNYVLYKR